MGKKSGGRERVVKGVVGVGRELSLRKNEKESVAEKTDGSNKFLPTVNEMRQEVRTTEGPGRVPKRLS